MCSLLAFSLILLVLGLVSLAKGELGIRRKNSAAAIRGKPAYVIGAVWTVTGAGMLCVALGSGTAVRLLRQLSDIPFIVGIARGLSQLAIIAGIVIFLTTALVVLFVPELQGEEKE